MDKDRLEQMLEAQRALQVRAYGSDPGILSVPDKIAFIKDMKLAIDSELQEMMDELGWKPWATSRHINFELAQGELVDAWHFFMNLMLALDMTTDQLFTGYLEKQARNQKRQEAGYNGLSGKCHGCGRALDDIATKRKVDIDEVWAYQAGRVICILCSTEPPTPEIEAAP